MRKYSISVAMATYNGEKFIKEQLDSILLNLLPQDEVIISDDGSTDKTLSIIKMLKDKRIKIVEGPHKGIKKNFENAISKCNGKYIFLSDQDDIWVDGKVNKIIEDFEKFKATLVIHNATIIDESLKPSFYESTFLWRNSKKGFLKNIFKNSYIGCCMAFDKSMIKYFLPIPNDVEMHDQWLGIINEKYGHSYFEEKKLILYRRHDGNFSNLSHYPFRRMLKNRLVFINEYRKR